MQACNIISGAKPDIGKKHTIATKPACSTELGSVLVIGLASAIHTCVNLKTLIIPVNAEPLL
jgi:carbonic anhydrase/acetyltransferase-like protein (isoleucine patch superfamily)